MPWRVTESSCRACGLKTKIVVETGDGQVTRHLFLEPATGISDEIVTHTQKLQYLREIERMRVERHMSSGLTMREIEEMKIFHSTEAQDRYLKNVQQSKTLSQMIRNEEQYADPVKNEERMLRNAKLFGNNGPP